MMERKRQRMTSKQMDKLDAIASSLDAFIEDVKDAQVKSHLEGARREMDRAWDRAQDSDEPAQADVAVGA